MAPTSRTLCLEHIQVGGEHNGVADMASPGKFSFQTDWSLAVDLAKTERGSWFQFKKGKKTETRDLRVLIEMGNNTKGEIKLRHDPSGTSGRFVIEFIGGGAEARGGSIGSTKLFHRIWSTVDSTAANNFLKLYDKGNEIGNHTYSHRSLKNINYSDFINEINKLCSMSITEIDEWYKSMDKVLIHNLYLS